MIYFFAGERNHCEYCNVDVKLVGEPTIESVHNCKVWHFFGELIEQREDNKQNYTKEDLLEEYKQTLDIEFKEIDDKANVIDLVLDIAEDLFGLEYYKAS